MTGQADGQRWREVLRLHLAEVPAFRALIRTIECRLLHEAGPLDPPVLDVGCGDGLFAAMACDGVIAAGIDLDMDRLREARRRGAHTWCVRADAARLPFADGAFGAVVANCALEHVEAIDDALAAIARVLRPGGRLVFGVPGPRFGEFLSVPSVLAPVGLSAAGRAYAAWFHRHSRHHHVYGVEEWTRRLGAHGLAVERSRPYMSARAHRAFDLAHYASVPRLVRWKLTGRWVGRPDGPVNAGWLRWLAPLVIEDPAEGAYLFFEARRVAPEPVPGARAR